VDKALTRLGDLIRRELRETEFLYGYLTAYSRIQRSIDDSSTSAPNFFEDLELPDPSHEVPLHRLREDGDELVANSDVSAPFETVLISIEFTVQLSVP
jgi:hypothetical protein